MGQLITIGYIVEGTTDIRFLSNIIRRTFENIALDCEREIDIYEPKAIFVKEDNFNDTILKASQIADKEGLLVLCVHCDSDAKNISEVQKNKIIPAFECVEQADDNRCKRLIPILPVQMTEAWMLADKNLFKEEISSQLSNHDLMIEKSPEQYADPKLTIENAIRIAQNSTARRRRKLDIAELYSPLGQKIDIKALRKLPSYEMFYKEVQEKLQNW